MTEKDKEAPYGRYASGRPRPKPPKKKKRGKGWDSVKYWVMMKWWSKAIERWRKGKVLVEKPASLRKQLRHHRVGVEGHAKSSLSADKMAPASIHTTIKYPLEVDAKGDLLTRDTWQDGCPFPGCGCGNRG